MRARHQAAAGNDAVAACMLSDPRGCQLCADCTCTVHTSTRACVSPHWDAHKQDVRLHAPRMRTIMMW